MSLWPTAGPSIGSVAVELSVAARAGRAGLDHTGDTSGSGSSANTLTTTISAPVGISVSRTVKVEDKGLKIVGKVEPDLRRTGVKILQVMNNKGTKTWEYATVKTNRKSVFSFRAPARRGFRFIAVIPDDAMRAGTTTVVCTVI